MREIKCPNDKTHKDIVLDFHPWGADHICKECGKVIKQAPVPGRKPYP